MSPPLLLAAMLTMATPCEPSFTCAEEIVAEATKSGGVDAGFAAIERVAKDTRYGAVGREHDLAHVIGHALAEKSHVRADVFLTCRDDWSFGCQHGFIEEALEGGMPVGDLREICETLPDWHRRFRCFHGIGHGLTMWEGNAFGAALRSCDALGAGTLTLACHQAVFHEAFKLDDAGEAPPGTYDDADPLFPCDRLDAAYRWGCYSRHAARLLTVERFDVRRAARWCLLAEEQYWRPCIAEFGQYAANPFSQRTLLKHTRSIPEGNALTLCDNAMPSGFAAYCREGAIAHLENRGEHVDREPRMGVVPNLPRLTPLQRLQVLLLKISIRSHGESGTWDTGPLDSR